ncbi:radical SAM family heme chaperone HemW [Undibacterium luofuense]|uniref:Heme chaperone HemW n=1 Tax=Undibacterium luofuense TaxID=2828733 RepID=A0A941DNI1_9BURK|nr:radical SAM family heme chaperone HemW [Undibacterium luofuense]MBR7782001.1 oxygen-independent coproporphyrinogen III oxidase-like protein [Undibacterium luofuense]
MIPIKTAAQAAKTVRQDLSAVPQTVLVQYLSPGALNLSALPPLSLYVHFPWCVRKCPYCDFNSHEHKPDSDEAAYLDALRGDLEAALPLIWGRRVQTVFIGGGTPSLLSAQGMDRLLSDIRTLLPLELDAEITMEANPGTFEVEKFRAYRDSGINRLSIGVQSFNNEFLQKLGRIHHGDEARRAAEFAAKHFDNINLDLMFALPGQTLEQCEQDVQTALSFGTSHLSLYHLTIEPNTYFAKFPPAIPDDDLSADMHQMLRDQLSSAGYINYEVSAYAKPGRMSRHNLNYWQFGDYLGIGAGAHSKLSFPHRIVRQMRHKQPKAYMQAVAEGNAAQESSEVATEDLPFEFMLNALRLRDGFPVALFQERTGLALNTIERELQLAEQKGLLYRDYQTIAPTETGRNYLNNLQEMFLK